MIRYLIQQKRQVGWNRITSYFLWAWEQKRGCFPFVFFPPSAYYKGKKKEKIEREINWGFCATKQCRLKLVSDGQKLPHFSKRDKIALPLLSALCFNSLLGRCSAKYLWNLPQIYQHPNKCLTFIHAYINNMHCSNSTSMFTLCRRGLGGNNIWLLELREQNHL